ncbi:peptide deformylase [Helicobacter monodelphidis]|uniref:peptide deformylase n=1 Tax=Helicobacter sp. 15-1451 TaxID=2004995 RepID=UPI000DCB5B9B|nr:peptide deformylase [Helicobacter sp. 15-1451]RAX57014.1 peptide deformylase [Helicobacter sp. 15-1451]
MLKILHYPDSFLRQKSVSVEVFDEDLAHFLDEMNVTMLANNGVGLAAVQVGRAIAALLVNIPDDKGEQSSEHLLEIINPKIIEKSGQILWNEGCLSVPDFYEDIQRYNTIVLSYQNRKGEKKQLEAEGYLAVAIQHEMDHLEGILFVDRLPILKRKKFEKLLKKQQRCSA